MVYRVNRSKCMCGLHRDLLVQFSACRVGNQMYILGNALLLKILRSQLFSLLNASNHGRKSGIEHDRTRTRAACLQTLTRSRGQGAVLLPRLLVVAQPCLSPFFLHYSQQALSSPCILIQVAEILKRGEKPAPGNCWVSAAESKEQ